jgi:hypothetical protein
LRTGFVQNIHANGPIVYSHENYLLNGALALTTFEIYLLVHPDPDCANQVAMLQMASLTTNVAGNGKAQAVLSPAMAPPSGPIYLRWEVHSGGTAAYSTVCSMVMAD